MPKNHIAATVHTSREKVPYFAVLDNYLIFDFMLSKGKRGDRNIKTG